MASDGTAKALIHRLVRDLRPVRHVRPGRLFVACLALEALVVLGAAYSVGPRADLAVRLSDPVYLVIVSVITVAAAWAASVAIRLSVPGRDVSAGAGVLLLAAPFVVAIAVIVARPWGGAWPGWAALTIGCLQCVGVTAASAALPWMVILVMLSRLAPLGELRVGLFAGISAFFVGALVTELHCAVGSSYHLALGHYLPVAVLAVLTCAVAAAVLRSRMRVSSAGEPLSMASGAGPRR